MFCKSSFFYIYIYKKTRAAMQCARRRTCFFRVSLYSRTVVNWRSAKFYFKIAEMYKIVKWISSVMQLYCVS